MMLNKVMILALFIVTVHGTQQGKANKLRKQRTKRRSRMLDLADLRRSKKCSLDQSAKGKTDAVHDAKIKKLLRGGKTISVRDQRAVPFVAVHVDAEATVLDLHVAVENAGVVLMHRTLTFRGQKLSDPVTLLAEIGMIISAEVEISVSEIHA